MFDRFFDINVEFVKCLLLAAGIGFIAFIHAAEKYKWGKKEKYFAEKILSVTAIISVFVFLNMGFMHYKGGFFQGHDFFRNYMTAKYFKEVGYLYLSDASIVADSEEKNFLEKIPSVRDQESFNFISREDVFKRKNKWRDKFSDKRWQQFKDDLNFFEFKPGVRTFLDYPISLTWWNWNNILTDYSYEASPLWMGVSRVITNIMPANAFSVMILAYLDLFLLGVMIIFISLSFNNITGFLTTIFFCSLAIPYFSWAGGSLVKLGWLLFLVFSLVMLKSNKPMHSGVFLALAGVSRIFPFIFIIPLAGKALINFVGERKFDKTAMSLAKGFGGAVVGGFILSVILVPEPLHNWSLYISGTFNKATAVEIWKMGFKDIFMWAGEVSENIPNNWQDIKAERLSVFYPLMAALWLAGIAALFLCLKNKKFEYWEAFSLGGCLLSFLFLYFSKVYYVYLILLVPYFLVDFKDSWRLLGAVFLFAMNILIFLLHTFQNTTFLIKFYFMFMLMLVFGYALYYQIELRKEKD